ncbi:MAG: hypothetical protein MUC35_00940 [Candidatus Margulisbacteria bacterium]|jgi:hypothetical protein|nr:hypothetical protein [Candidatus Margulisiibacteriota bacterium]
MPVFRPNVRPLSLVRQDLFTLGIRRIGLADIRSLTQLPDKKYDALIDKLRAAIKETAFDELLIDPAPKLLDIPFDRVPLSFLRENIRGMALDLTKLRRKWLAYSRRQSWPVTPEFKPQRPQEVPIAPAPVVLKAAALLTDQLLFDPRSGAGYPRTAEEYKALIGLLIDDRGRFPGDSEALLPNGTFAARQGGVRHLQLRRRGENFDVEIISPVRHAQGVKNRLIFDVDLISQAASFEAYGTPGVSYDRESYYVRRLFDADRVPFIRWHGFPVSFAAVQSFQTMYAGQELSYAFIHFVMTRGLFQGSGLTSYAIRESLSSLYYGNAWHNRPALLLQPDGAVDHARFKMWAFAHSGRFTPFYAFIKGMASVGQEQELIAAAIFDDIHRRITEPADLVRRDRPLLLGVRSVNGGTFPLALDSGVYPPHTRYPVKHGQPVFPQSEIDRPSQIRHSWLEAIGGERGVQEGNGLYFGGLVTLGAIRSAKRREKERDGGGVIEQTGDRLRSWLVSRS